MTPEEKNIEGLTVCRHCHHGLTLSATPIIGESPQERARRFVMALGDHLKRKHPEVIPSGAAFIQLFGDVCILQHYTSQEPIVVSAYEVARALVHAMTRKNVLTDDDLREGLAQFGKDAAEVEALMPIARYLRDFLSEQGQFEHPAVKAARENSQKS